MTEPALTWSDTLEDIDWEALSALYRTVPGNKPAEHLRAVFHGRLFRCFVRRSGALVAAGRALADGRDVA